MFEGEWTELVVVFVGDALTLMQLLFLVTDRLPQTSVNCCPVAFLLCHH